MGEIATRFEVTEQSPHRWRNPLGGMKREEMKRRFELERENARLKLLFAGFTLDNWG